MNEDGSDEAHPLRERFAEVRGEHGWARYVEDDVLAAWLRPAPRRDERGSVHDADDRSAG